MLSRTLTRDAGPDCPCTGNRTNAESCTTVKTIKRLTFMLNEANVYRQSELNSLKIDLTR